MEEANANVGVCQICMELVPSLDLVTNLCGKTCTAHVCLECLIQHLAASVYSYYPGVLPKMRCPACLKLMNKSQWGQFVQPPPFAMEGGDDDLWFMDHSHITEKYVILCQQSMEFQSPCCHNPQYSMLPMSVEELAKSGESFNAHVSLPRSLVKEIPKLRKKCRAYCFHRISTSEFYDHVMRVFGDYAHDVFWKLMPLILDEERRATLILHHLHLQPDTYTLCCGEPVCFKCKSNDHHNGECGDFSEINCVQQCRGCHVTLVKVDGCDSVTCVCGYQFDWSAELARLKALTPQDDQEYHDWTVWSSRIYDSFYYIHEIDRTRRRLRLDAMIRRHQKSLRKLIVGFRKRRQAQATQVQQQQIPKLETSLAQPPTDVPDLIKQSPFGPQLPEEALAA